MEGNILFILVFILILIGVIATIIIGNSQKNKEGDPTYDQKTEKKWLRLTLIYAFVIIVGYLMFLLYTLH